jgi:hypothetical protein
MPTARNAAFATLVLLILWPSGVRSLHWWRSTSVVAELALTPTQVTDIERLYDEGSAERYGFAETTSALLRHLEELNDANASDSELLPLTAQLASVAVMASVSAKRRMSEGLERVLRPNQQMRLKQLVATRRVDLT